MVSTPVSTLAFWSPIPTSVTEDRLIQRKYPKRRDRARRQPPELVQAEAEVLRVAAPSGQTRRRAEGPDAASTGAFVPMPKGIRHCVAWSS